MTADLSRQSAAQAKADEIRTRVGDWDGVGPRLLVAVIDPDTNTRLATTFAGYSGDVSPGPLRLVREAS
ncbi:hypothetical protein AB0K53_01050 [Streptomyces tuirus]|uniref:hypothetical protein n=1 Tax=Streptomyces tuirus TaxID=68278 RepID=UPI00343ADA2D